MPGVVACAHHVDAGGVEQRARDDHPHGAEAVGDRARERLRRAVEQRLHRDREREHSRPQPCACDIGVRKKPSAERGPKPIMEIRQPHAR
jgi:hypothetical protein